MIRVIGGAKTVVQCIFQCFIFTVYPDFSVTIVIGKQSGSKCVIRVIGGATRRIMYCSIFNFKKDNKKPLPLNFFSILYSRSDPRKKSNQNSSLDDIGWAAL